MCHVSDFIAAPFSTAKIYLKNWMCTMPVKANLLQIAGHLCFFRLLVISFQYLINLEVNCEKAN